MIEKIYSYYAGRLKLISFVLTLIQTYWDFVYLLPKTVVNEIDKALKDFLWNQHGNNGGKAKISWKVIYYLKTKEVLASNLLESGMKYYS